MEEKVLVKSQRYNIGKFMRNFVIGFTALCALICIIIYISSAIGFETCTRQESRWVCNEATAHYLRCELHDIANEGTEFAIVYNWVTFTVIGCLAVVVALLCWLIYAWMCSYEIIVTDKRVYGKAAFGRRVDLPLDSVSSIGTQWPKGISVATSSGKITFLMIKNRGEVHEVVSNLLIERQNRPAASATTIITRETTSTSADEIKKYKELLDMGAITQEEFAAKKKQLLGL